MKTIPALIIGLVASASIIGSAPAQANPFRNECNRVVQDSLPHDTSSEWRNTLRNICRNADEYTASCYDDADRDMSWMAPMETRQGVLEACVQEAAPATSGGGVNIEINQDYGYDGLGYDVP